MLGIHNIHGQLHYHISLSNTFNINLLIKTSGKLVCNLYQDNDQSLYKKTTGKIICHFYEENE